MTRPADSDKSTNVRPSSRSSRAANQRVAPDLVKTAFRWGTRLSPHLASAAALRLFLTPRRLRRPIPEEAVLLTGARSEVVYKGMRLPVWTWGEGPTVLLVHGWEARGSQLARAYAEPLAERGYRVVTFDMPGHGDAPDAQTSMLDFADVVAHLGQALGPLHAVIAHSMGGAATLTAHAAKPVAKNLVIIAAPLHPLRFLKMFGDAVELTDAVRAGMIALLEARHGVPIEDIDTRKHAPTIHAPVLVVHDNEDPAVPYAHGAALASALPNATFITTRGLAHQRVLRAPEVLEAVAKHLGPKLPKRSLAEVVDLELFAPELRTVA